MFPVQSIRSTQTLALTAAAATRGLIRRRFVLTPKPFPPLSCHSHYRPWQKGDRLGTQPRLFSSDSDTTTTPTTVLVIGSSGALGSTIARYLSQELQMRVIGADVCELPNFGDWDLDGFVSLPHLTHAPSLGQVTAELTTGLYRELPSNNNNENDDEYPLVQAIICASGGWQGDTTMPKADATDEEVEQGAMEYGNTIDKMIQMNVYPVAASGYVADRFMDENGLLVVVGATAALGPTPGMMGYGMSKTAAHHFVHTLGASSGKNMVSKSMRTTSRRVRRHHGVYLDSLSVVGVLPSMLDTPSNRAAAGNNDNIDFSKWTKPIDIAKEIGQWLQRPTLRPHSGSLVKVVSDEKGSTFELVR